jgi:enterochelin esterase family protein
MSGIVAPSLLTVTFEGVTFRLRDPRRQLRAVNLHQEVAAPRGGWPLRWQDGVWTLDFPRPAVDRMEYLLELTHNHGGRDLICDPANSRRAPGPFGDKSVVEFPGYRTPAWWLDGPPGRSKPPTTGHGGAQTVHLRLDSDQLRGQVPLTLWTSAGADPEGERPLLVVHDGPQTNRYSSLLVLLARMVAVGRLPPLRVALLAPVDRHETYSGSPAYAKALAKEILPVLRWLAPAPKRPGMRVGMGASLGALAMMHLHRAYPGTLDGLFLQSGSFFRMRTDPQESGYARFRRISRFVGEILSSRRWEWPVPVTMTCGAVEENLANNRAVADALRAQGYPLRFVVNRDAHNWVGWRDCLDPHLVDLLAALWW